MFEFSEFLNEFLENKKYKSIDEFRESDDLLYEVNDIHILRVSKHKARLAREKKVTHFLYEKSFVPTCLFFLIDNGYACYFREKIDGEPLCSKKYLDNPDLVVRLLAEAVKMLHSIDVKDCEIESFRSIGDVFVHGKLLLSNIIIKDDKINGFINFYDGGVGFEWQDYAWSIWSLEKCLGTKDYTKKYLDLLGIEFDQYYYDMVINNDILEID